MNKTTYIAPAITNISADVSFNLMAVSISGSSYNDLSLTDDEIGEEEDVLVKGSGDWADIWN